MQKFHIDSRNRKLIIRCYQKVLCFQKTFILMGEFSLQVFFLILFLILLIAQLNPLNPKPQGSGFIMGIINFMPTSYRRWQLKRQLLHRLLIHFRIHQLF